MGEISQVKDVECIPGLLLWGLIDELTIISEREKVDE